MSRYKINYQTPVKVRWDKLAKKISRMDIRERRRILLAATEYRSSEDSCNSIYMGGMAHASLRQALGDTSTPYEKLIPSVSEERLMAGIMAAMHTIEYMLANPVGLCPCCGQIVRK